MIYKKLQAHFCPALVFWACLCGPSLHPGHGFFRVGHLLEFPNFFYFWSPGSYASGQVPFKLLLGEFSPTWHTEYYLQDGLPPWGGGGNLRLVGILYHLYSHPLTQRGMFSVLGTCWGLIFSWQSSSRSCSLCGKWAFVSQWEFCLRANSKRSPQSLQICLNL